MAIKNKRTSVKKVTTDSRLKKKLKEDYDNFLHEEDDELPTDDSTGVDTTGGDDMDFDDTGADEPNGDLGGETDSTGGEGMGDEFDADLDPTQKEWMDAEVDELLGGSLAADGEGDEYGLDEDDISMSGGDDMMMEDEFDMDQDSDIGVEDPATEVGDVDPNANNHGVHVDHGDDVFTAEELNAIIGSDDSLHDLDDSLVQKVGDMDDEQAQAGIDDIESDGIGGMEGYDDMESDDDDLYEDAGDHKEPMTGLKGEDHGSFEQGYEGGKNPKLGFKVKDELMEADVMKALGWEEEKPKTEGKNGKVTKDAKKGNIPDKKNLGDNDYDKITQTVKESLKKSKMLVKAGSVIVKLKEAIKQLQVENYKLTKANGVLAAVGDRLTKETRKKVTESFSKCKSEKEVNTIYEKVVAAVRKNNAARPSLNEAVQGRKTVVKTVVKESEAAPQQKVKTQLTEATKRKMMLMGIEGFDSQYYNL